MSPIRETGKHPEQEAVDGLRKIIKEKDALIERLKKALEYFAEEELACVCSPDSEGCDLCENRIAARALLTGVKE